MSCSASHIYCEGPNAQTACLLQGFEKDQVSTEMFLNLRYDGTDVAVMTSCSSDSTYEEAFENTYKREFGFVLEERSIQVSNGTLGFLGSISALTLERCKF